MVRLPEKVALITGIVVGPAHPIAIAAWADVAATAAVFAFSAAHRNSSFYDPYWSAVPIAIVLFWALVPDSPDVNAPRVLLVFGFVALWGCRLTFNWVRGWQGLQHEDWRYVRLQEQTGRAYWLVSFSGIHMMPTIWVFLGLLPVYAAVAVGTKPLGALDLLAALVTAAAIAIEARADQELRRFRTAPGRQPGDILASGLWARSRHPNYLGEISFWWGLYLFGLAAAPDWWWTIVGPASITLMFRFVSLPMLETRMLERRPDFAQHQKRTSMVIPWPRKAA